MRLLSQELSAALFFILIRKLYKRVCLIFLYNCVHPDYAEEATTRIYVNKHISHTIFTSRSNCHGNDGVQPRGYSTWKVHMDRGQAGTRLQNTEPSCNVCTVQC